MQDSDRDLQIMNAMIGMCRQVKTAIVAEMIETQKQAQSLLALGVEFGQGYYFGKPGDTLALLSPLRAGARILDRARILSSHAAPRRTLMSSSTSWYVRDALPYKKSGWAPAIAIVSAGLSRPTSPPNRHTLWIKPRQPHHSKDDSVRFE
jgi:hypothetical protein